LPEGSQVESAGDLLGGQLVVTNGEDCRLSLYGYKRHDFAKHHDYIRPCDHQLATTSLMGENAIVDISAGGQVRVVPVRSLAYRSVIIANHSDPLAQPSSLVSSTISFALPGKYWSQTTSWQFAFSSKWAAIALHTPSGTFIRWVNQLNPTQMIDKFFANVDKIHLLPGAQMMLVEKEAHLFLSRLFEDESQLSLLASFDKLSRNDIAILSLEKDRTFFLQDGTNQVTRWVLHRDANTLGFIETYQFLLNADERLIDIKEHASINVVAALTDKQRLLFINRVSGEVVTTIDLPEPMQSISWFGNRLYGYNDDSIFIWRANNLSGITTWRSLFAPQHYEGYTEADTVWQTTNATDFQEAKFSLTPLIIGSLKASLLALFIAIPVAIGAAIYTAFFAKERLRHALKPAIEMLEAVPSVLIGFIAAIWLAPMAEQFLFSFAFFLIVVPFVLIAVAFFQRPVADRLPAKLRHGAELGFALLGVFILGYISVAWAPEWVFSLINVDGFDMLAAESDSPIGKTTIVVAIALGVAISPSIYSIAEDAIGGVPDELKHASFALGATRLQTLKYIVLHVAFPGIMAAIMLGFGRAFGETMIVLMVTGNTPISSWGLIEGLRALTANLAIELPEADVSSAHYQILFFTAGILFVFTFVVNTIAEFTRQRLRSRSYYE
jgi:phosphate transport system permease protein